MHTLDPEYDPANRTPPEPGLTFEQADAARRAVCAQFPAYVTDGAPGPALVRDYAWGEHQPPADYALVWEENSPYDWPQLVPGGGVDEELTALALDFDPTGRTISVPPAPDWPEHVGSEPINGIALGLYLDN